MRGGFYSIFRSSPREVTQFQAVQRKAPVQAFSPETPFELLWAWVLGFISGVDMVLT